jgi:hypothetical protein
VTTPCVYPCPRFTLQQFATAPCQLHDGHIVQTKQRSAQPLGRATHSPARTNSECCSLQGNLTATQSRSPAVPLAHSGVIRQRQGNHGRLCAFVKSCLDTNANSPAHIPAKPFTFLVRVPYEKATKTHNLLKPRNFRIMSEDLACVISHLQGGLEPSGHLPGTY